jgi:hypothetical protein
MDERTKQRIQNGLDVWEHALLVDHRVKEWVVDGYSVNGVMYGHYEMVRPDYEGLIAECKEWLETGICPKRKKKVEEGIVEVKDGDDDDAPGW